MESLHNWIIPGKQVWLRLNDSFTIGTITARDEKVQSATCRTNEQPSVTVSFCDIYEYSQTQK